MEAQTEQIYEALMDRRELNPQTALREFGCFRLAARIHDLRDRGIRVRTRMAKRRGRRYAAYSIVADWAEEV